MKTHTNVPANETRFAQFHVVVMGETLSRIACRYYNDADLYPRIFEANRDQLTDPDKIKPGQMLRIP